MQLLDSEEQQQSDRLLTLTMIAVQNSVQITEMVYIELDSYTLLNGWPWCA